jgi:hypothetical protein
MKNSPVLNVHFGLTTCLCGLSGNDQERSLGFLPFSTAVAKAQQGVGDNPAIRL